MMVFNRSVKKDWTCKRPSVRIFLYSLIFFTDIKWLLCCNKYDWITFHRILNKDASCLLHIQAFSRCCSSFLLWMYFKLSIKGWIPFNVSIQALSLLYICACGAYEPIILVLVLIMHTRRSNFHNCIHYWYVTFRAGKLKLFIVPSVCR